MHLSRSVGVILWCVIAACSAAAISGTKYQQRAAAFGFGAVGATAPQTRALEAVGQTVSSHPLFESLYIGEPDRVVARTAYGKVTARDLYLYLLTANSQTKPYILELYDKAIIPSEKSALADQVRKAIDDYVFVNFVVPQLVAKEQWTEVDEARARVAALAGYQFVYITDIVKPKINIRPADRVKYLQEHRNEIAQPERWRVRYIFLRSEETDPLDLQDAVQKKMEDIRADILRGKIDFAEAARQYSQAPSAANGGEIPPFRRGELFFYFEQAAANLKPGEVSEVIHGPHGFYLVQLLEVLPAEELSMENPEQAAKVVDGVTRQVMRAQYLWDLKVLLEEKARPLYVYKPWDEKRPEDVVGEVAGFKITKGQLLNMYPAIESEDFTRRDALIDNVLKRILEGEILAMEVTKAGLADSPFIQRVNEFAHHLAMLEKLREKYACDLKPSRDTVRRFWRDNPRLFTPLPMQRVVKISLVPLNTAPTPEQTLAELERALREGGGEAPSPLAPKMPATSADEAAEPMPTSSEEALSTTSLATSGGEPQATTATEAREDRATTAPGGGAPPLPPAGGTQKSSENESNVYAKPATATQQKPASWYTPLMLEPVTETEEPSIQRVRRAKPQGATRSITPTQLREVVQNYQSGDWQLKYEDFGFIYVEDHPQIPREVVRLGAGEYLAPKLEGQTAVTYYVEAVRRLTKPKFEEIESYVYGVWRDVEVMKKLDAARRKGLDKARIEYSF
ncbi:Peptidyl-prolyl cis-trans isomerase PpiD [Candidatus Sumerlaea chitinivorans]|uniref:Peptidyl-prolyl cis-trans isomerase PpiD n=1 Tax=Sumerlaea chitinivorans TaxID=2250252 RepID=A0A2Z4Y898_SUMC1|nr:Peptidyl-prolyl cis-trans isomerase PpiD [Candidatus Sumerlaea chitinivorans]